MSESVVQSETPVDLAPAAVGATGVGTRVHPLVATILAVMPKDGEGLVVFEFDAESNPLTARPAEDQAAVYVVAVLRGMALLATSKPEQRRHDIEADWLESHYGIKGEGTDR